MLRPIATNAPAVTCDEKGSLRLTIANRLDALNESLDRMDGFFEREGASPKLAYIARLTLEELVTNTIKYGYDDSNEHHISVVLQLGAPTTMMIEDDGHPFNPLADAPEPDLTTLAEDRPLGGLGLHMVRTMAASLNYQRAGAINRLRVVFPTGEGDR